MPNSVTLAATAGEGTLEITAESTGSVSFDVTNADATFSAHKIAFALEFLREISE